MATNAQHQAAWRQRRKQEIEVLRNENARYVRQLAAAQNRIRKLMAEIKKIISPQQHKLVFYKSKEVKRLLKCSDSTLQHFRQSGKLPAKKVRGTYYYTQEDVNSLFSSKN